MGKGKTEKGKKQKNIKSSSVVNKHVDTSATNKMTFEPCGALSHEDVASSAWSVLGIHH